MLAHSLFMEPWWLDIVAPGRWRQAVVEKKSKIIARMPYVVKRRFGVKAITSAPLTPYLGPYWEPIRSKNAKRIGKEKDLIFALVDQLPSVQLIRIPCHPDLTNAQPFYWKGFDLSFRYTYRIKNLSDLDEIWRDFRGNIRTDIRKAQKQLSVRSDLPLEVFWDISAKTFGRQRKTMPYKFSLLRKINDALEERKQKKMLFAVDAKDRVHAACYIVWDERCVYYLIGGSDPELRKSGANSLVMWEAIKHASYVADAFDFEGSMIESVERFFRSLGGRQTISYIVEKIAPSLKVAIAVTGLLKKLFSIKL